MKLIIQIIVVIAIIYAALFSVTQSQLTASLPLLLLGIGSLLMLVNYKCIRWSWNTQSILFLFVTLYAFTRAWLSPVKSLAAQDLFLILSASILYFLVVFNVSKSKCSWYNTFIIVFFIIATLNVLMMIPQLNELRDALLGFAEGEKNTGLYNHRNFYGNMMMMCSLAFLCLAAFSSYSKLWRILFILLAVGAATGVIFSSARASLLGLGIGGIVFLVLLMLKFRIKNKVFLGITFLVFLLVGVSGFKLALNNVLQKRTEMGGAEASVQSGELSDRLSYFAMAVDQSIESPIVGNGSRSYLYLSYQNRSHNLSPFALDHGHVHNEFLQVLCEYGVVGLLLIIAFLCYHIIYGGLYLYRNAYTQQESLDNHKRNDWAMTAVGMCVVIGGASNMLLSFPAHCLPNLLIFLVGLALIGVNVRAKSQGEAPMQAKVSGVVVGLGLFLLAFIFGQKEFRASSAFHQNGIVVDDLNWKVNEETVQKWKPSLEIAIDISPTFDRANKLGVIYLHEAKFAANLKLKNNLLEKAFQQFTISKSLNRFDPVSRLNLADILSQKKLFEEADLEFSNAEKMAKYREAFFDFYSNWAINDRSIALKLWSAGKQEEAIHRLESGIIKCEKSEKALKIEHAKVAEEKYALSSTLLKFYYASGKTDKALNFIDEYFIPLAKGKIRYMENIIPLQDHTRWVFNYGVGLWKTKNYSKSLVMLNIAARQYRILQDRIGLTDKDQENLTIVQNLLKILSSPKFDTN